MASSSTSQTLDGWCFCSWWPLASLPPQVCLSTRRPRSGRSSFDGNIHALRSVIYKELLNNKITPCGDLLSRVRAVGCISAVTAPTRGQPGGWRRRLPWPRIGARPEPPAASISRKFASRILHSPCPTGRVSYCASHVGIEGPRHAPLRILEVPHRAYPLIAGTSSRNLPDVPGNFGQITAELVPTAIEPANGRLPEFRFVQGQVRERHHFVVAAVVEEHR
jgi:hypothetical protein